MHLNKLSTAALMRLSILAALNLVMVRVLGRWMVLLHPLFFLSILTIDLGLYALMVYSGSLNRTLIAMMLTGLAGVLAIVVRSGGVKPAVFMYGGSFHELALLVQAGINRALAIRPSSRSARMPLNLSGDPLYSLAHLALDLVGLSAILAVGWLARALQSRSRRPVPPASPPLDSEAASPL